MSNKDMSLRLVTLTCQTRCPDYRSGRSSCWTPPTRQPRGRHTGGIVGSHWGGVVLYRSDRGTPGPHTVPPRYCPPSLHDLMAMGQNDQSDHFEVGRNHTRYAACQCFSIAFESFTCNWHVGMSIENEVQSTAKANSDKDTPPGTNLDIILL